MHDLIRRIYRWVPFNIPMIQLTLLSVIGFNLHAQCPTGVLVLSSDEELEAFAKNYPNCTELDSSLIIGPDKDMAKTRITELDALKNIKYVNGDLIVSNNPWLKSIEPLKNIEIVLGDYKIPILKEMVEETLYFNLNIVKGSMTITESCMECKTKLIFKDLIKVGKSLNTYGYLYKPSQHEFPALWKVGGSLMSISHEGKFREHAFPNLSSVGGSLNITSSKEEYTYFQNLTSVDYLELSFNRGQRIFIGQIQKCKSLNLKGELKHTNTSFYGLDSLTTLRIDKPNEKVANSLPHLRHVDRMYLSKSDESIIKSLPSLRSIDEVNVFDKNSIQFIKNVENIKLIKISGLDSELVSHVPTAWKIEKMQYEYNAGKNISGEIKFEPSELRINNNKKTETIQLKSSKALQAVHLNYNENLVDISQMNIPITPEGKLYISSNKKLNQCVTEMVCKFVKENNKSKLTIRDNGPDCTKEKVILACQTF